MQTIIPRWLAIAVASLLSVLLLLVVADHLYSLKNKISSRADKNTISVTGEAKISGTPDMAVVTAGINLTGSSASDVQNRATEQLNKLTAFVTSQGIDKANITTSNFNLYPQQGYDPRSGTPTKDTTYMASQQITIKVKGVDKNTDMLSKLLGGLTDNGANQINGISFTFDDADALKEQARKEAIEKAKQKAKELAQETGITLGKVLDVSEGSSGYGTPVPMMYDSYGVSAEAKSVAPAVEPGNQDVTVSMTLVYEVK